jgi:murein DD-endopeptidase MepM/ murein hydrolase activator NlpD
MIPFETVQKAHPMGHVRKILFVALAVLASPLVAGCMPDTPETQLTWDANTRITKHQNRVASAASASSGGARTYVYQDKYAPKPSARPTPNYVTRNVTPYAVTSQPLSSVYADRSGASNVPSANAPTFAWPVSGRVISDFGATNSGGKNDGINIATNIGAPIHASASGTVTYAGSELKGYGNLVLLKHSGGYTTAYAHADRLVVQKGDFVARGQVIGYSGQTGDVNSPQLHFEIRSATTPVNPRTYLSSTTASNQANF